MKLKLAAILAATVLGLAGCGGASNTGNTGNTTNSANRPTNTTSQTTTATPDPNMVKANANASDEVGGTKEGCKCSAAGMKCSTKAGEKGCCGKEGECSTMVDGKSACCSSEGGDGAACCSAAGKVASGENTGAPGATKPAAPTGKS